MEKKNTVCNTNQHWNRFNSWWDSSKAILKCSNTLDKKVFDAGSREYFEEDLESVMTKLSHLQRAHILALYVKYLQPLTNISHFEGKTLKNYVDAICRRLRELEGQQTVLSERYGNWSWACERDSHYEVLRKERKLKIVTEELKNQQEKRTLLQSSHFGCYCNVHLKKQSIFTIRGMFTTMSTQWQQQQCSSSCISVEPELDKK